MEAGIVYIYLYFVGGLTRLVKDDANTISPCIYNIYIYISI